MTEKELISKLQGLKQIKPRENWVVFAKSEIFSNNLIENKSNVFSNVLNVIFQRKFAYAFAVFLFIFAGGFGFMKYGFPGDTKVAQQSTVVLASIKSNVESFNIKSQNLADALKDKSQNPDLAIKEVKNAANKLTDELQKNPQLAKVIALDVNNNNSLLNIPGGNDVSEVIDMCKAIVTPLIEDLKKRTLTEDQETELKRIESHFNNGGNCTTALRDMLLMNASRDSKNN